MHYEEFDNAALDGHPTEAWEHVKFKDTIAKVTNTEIFYKAITFYPEQSPLMLNDLLAVMAQRVDHVRVILQVQGGPPSARQAVPSLDAAAQHQGGDDALYELYVLEEDHESLAAGVVEYTNFDSIEMAQMCEKHALLQFRRIGAMLYKKGQKWSQSVALSKQDKVWDEAIATTSESGDAALAEDLLNFFVAEKLNACFSACLFTCYSLLQADVVLELAWRNNLQDFAMPFMLQTMRELQGKVDALVEKERKKEEAEAEKKKQEEEALAQGYNGGVMGAVDAGAMVAYGACGGGMAPGYQTGMGYGYGA